MIFAKFYHDSTGWNGVDFSGPVELIPAVGSDSVYIVDSRLCASNILAVAAVKRYWRRLQSIGTDYRAFRLYRSADGRFDEDRPITMLVILGD